MLIDVENELGDLCNFLTLIGSESELRVSIGASLFQCIGTGVTSRAFNSNVPD